MDIAPKAPINPFDQETMEQVEQLTQMLHQRLPIVVDDGKLDYNLIDGEKCIIVNGTTSLEELNTWKYYVKVDNLALCLDIEGWTLLLIKPTPISKLSVFLHNKAEMLVFNIRAWWHLRTTHHDEDDMAPHTHPF